MHTTERQRHILNILAEKKRCSVKTLSELLYISEATVRRELNTLAAEGKIQKIFGGALLYEHYSEEVPFAVRKDRKTEIKQQICAEAAKVLREGMTVFLDASTTPEHLVEHLKHYRHLQIVTNNPRLPMLLTHTDLQIYSTGGLLSHSSQAYVGSVAEDMLANINADIFFFSARGLSQDGRITDSAMNECHIKQKMLEKAAVSCFLCDSEKIGQAYMCTIASCADVDYVFSDVPLDSALLGKQQRSDRHTKGAVSHGVEDPPSPGSQSCP